MIATLLKISSDFFYQNWLQQTFLILPPISKVALASNYVGRNCIEAIKGEGPPYLLIGKFPGDLYKMDRVVGVLTPVEVILKNIYFIYAPRRPL